MSIVDNITEAHELELYERGVLEGIKKAYREIEGLYEGEGMLEECKAGLRGMIEFHEQVVKDVSCDDGYDEDGDEE
jgi:hypothetical protein